MKWLKVNAYQVALLFKDGVYTRMVSNGNYWLWQNESSLVYDVTKPFTAPIELNMLLQDETFANAVEVVEVKDNEIVLVYVNDILNAVLTAGRFTYWKSLVNYRFVKADTSSIEVNEQFSAATLTNKLMTPYVRSYTVESYEQAILFVDGKFVRHLNSGVYYWWRNTQLVFVGKVDTRQQQAEINGQEILTKDKAALRVNAYGQYKVVDIERALLQNKEYERQLYISFQLVLREYIGALSLDELLEKKDLIAPYILKAVAANANVLGVEVTGFGIRDIVLPGDVKEIMNQVLIAERKAQSNSIMRREETASTRSLLNTAKLMEDNAMLFRLKEMEYVERIAEKVNSISVSGNGVVLDQLKQLFGSQNK